MSTQIFNVANEFDAYFVGFIQTDGHLQHKKVSVELNSRDQDILTKIQASLGGSIKFRTRETNFKEKANSAIWTLCSVDFVKSLNNFGIPCGKKSHIIRPLQIRRDLERHYIRGLFDGDGTLCFSQTNFPIMGIVTASEAIKNYLVNWLRLHEIFVNCNRNQRDDIYNITITRESAQKIAHILYHDCSVSIDRKRKIANEIIKWERPSDMPKGQRSFRWTPIEYRVLEENKYDAQKICELKLLPNRSEKSIILMCGRINKGWA